MSTEFLKGGGSKLGLRMDSPGEYQVSGYTASLDITTVYELPFTTESFNPTGEFINSNAIAGGRARGIGCIGNKAGDGSFDTEVTIGNFLYLMYAALGKVAAVDSVAPLGDIILVHSPDDLPSYDVYVKHGGTDETIMKFEECTVSSLRMSFASNSLLTASIDWSGKRKAADSYTDGDAVAVGDIIRGSDGNIYICDAAIEEFDDDINIPSEPDANWELGLGTTYFEPFSSEQVFICPIRIGTEILLENSDAGLTAFNLLPFTTALELTISNGLDTDTNSLDASGRLAILSGEFSVTGSLTFLVPKHTSGVDTEQDSFNELLAELDIGTLFGTELRVYLYKDETDGVGDTTKEYYVLKLHNVYATQPTHDITDRGKVAYRVDFQAVSDPDAYVENYFYEEPIEVDYVEDAPVADNQAFLPIEYTLDI
ncbi:MAG: phage tail tube protein [Clostridia bacterium]|jgi:hypothetical protein